MRIVKGPGLAKPEAEATTMVVTALSIPPFRVVAGVVGLKRLTPVKVCLDPSIAIVVELPASSAPLTVAAPSTNRDATCATPTGEGAGGTLTWIEVRTKGPAVWGTCTK